MNTNNNNELKIRASNQMKELIRKHIDKQSNESIINVNGREIIGKYLEDIDLIVRMNSNVYSFGFLNCRDICRVIGETLEGKIIVKRLEDGHVGIVVKEKLDLPMWLEYDL